MVIAWLLLVVYVHSFRCMQWWFLFVIGLIFDNTRTQMDRSKKDGVCHELHLISQQTFIVRFVPHIFQFIEKFFECFICFLHVPPFIAHSRSYTFRWNLFLFSCIYSRTIFFFKLLYRDSNRALLHFVQE